MTVVLLIIAAAMFLWVVTAYNRLVELKAQSYAAWRDVDIQLARRSDLASRLVRGMKGAVDHENERLDAVTTARLDAAAARTNAQPSGGVQTLAESESRLTNALSRLTVVAEQHPHIKTTGSIGQLLEDLRVAEDRISDACDQYTEAASAYNSLQQQFPERLVATLARGESLEPWSPTKEGRLLKPVTV